MTRRQCPLRILDDQDVAPRSEPAWLGRIARVLFYTAAALLVGMIVSQAIKAIGG